MEYTTLQTIALWCMGIFFLCGPVVMLITFAHAIYLGCPGKIHNRILEFVLLFSLVTLAMCVLAFGLP